MTADSLDCVALQLLGLQLPVRDVNIRDQKPLAVNNAMLLCVPYFYLKELLHFTGYFILLFFWHLYLTVSNRLPFICVADKLGLCNYTNWALIFFLCFNSVWGTVITSRHCSCGLLFDHEFIRWQ